MALSSSLIAGLIRGARMLAGKSKRRRSRLPRQVPPTLIEREYRRALIERVGKSVVRAAFAELLAELPALLAGAERDRTRTDAGEGKRARELIDKARAKMRAKITPTEIEALSERFGERVALHNRIQLGRQTNAALGVDVTTRDPGLRAMIEGFQTENAALITNIADTVAARIESRVNAAITGGRRHEALAEDLDEEFGFGERRSKLIARDQIGKLYGQINAARTRELGVKRGIWRTVGDERVRNDPKRPINNHVDLDGVEFNLDNPPFGMLPGVPIQCRCSFDPVFDDVLDDIDKELGDVPDDIAPEFAVDQTRVRERPKARKR